MQLASIAAFTLAAFLVPAGQLLNAGPIRLQSEATQTPLLELFTSEGCSSCPPAETWLSRLKDSPTLWKSVVPVAFHVDYWDDLGWKDPFSRKAYTERQSRYADSWRSDSVYTPGFVLNGREWRNWSNREKPPRSSSQSVGVLTARSGDGKEWSLRFHPVGKSAPEACEFYAALLGFDLSADVKAGENRGRKLGHDFVVLALAKGKAHSDGEAFRGVLSLDMSSGAASKRLAVAAWVTPAGSMQPLQSVGGWLSSGNQVR